MKHREAAGTYVTAVGAAVNMLLAAVKIAVGLWGGSAALVSDGIHSLSDLISDMVVVVGLLLGGRGADADHPYGHGRFETMATGGVGLMLIGAGAGIGWSAVQTLLAWHRGGTLPEVSQYALWVAVASMITKEWLYRWTLAWGGRLKSSVIVANAWHHRSDALSSLAVSVGIAAAVFLGPSARVADPITALAVSFFILWEALSILRDVLSELSESGLATGELEWIRRAVQEIEGLHCPHSIRTRRVGPVVAVELHVGVEGGLSVAQAHALVERLEEKLRERFGQDAIVTIHVDPLEVIERCEKR